MIKGKSYLLNKNQNESLFKLGDFQFMLGDTIALVGLNGTGKSTFISTLLNDSNKYKGELYLQDHLIPSYSSKALHEIISSFKNDTYFFGFHTVTSFIKLGASNSSIIDLDGLLSQFELKHLKDNLIVELSDGEKQRALLCYTLYKNTEVIILDEPSSFLDIKQKKALFEYLKSISSEKLILVATHEIDLALKYCDKVMCINQKKEAKILTTSQFNLNCLY